MTSPSPAARPFTDLAELLVALRRAARLSQRNLAARASISRGTVQNAEFGHTAPSALLLDAYLKACGADSRTADRAHRLRTRGRSDQRGRLRELNAPAPALIHDRHDLAVALAAAYERAGAPPLGDRLLIGDRKPLPRTTAWRIVKRKGLPADVTQLETFLTACGISPAVQRLYTDAYRRVTATRPVRPAPPRARRNDIRTIVEARAERHELTGTAAAIARQLPAEVLKEILFTAITREAQRNGSGLPDVWIASSPFQDTGVDISMRSAAGDRMDIQVKNYRRPEPPPHTPGPGAPPSRPGSSRSVWWSGPRRAAPAPDQPEARRPRDYDREAAAVLAAPAR
ncbi:helix-turn-helix transcriptional regulator [Streptomyces cyaneofuscatus]|uniref:helix-turn-helix domain-containing protein n=1 Tax=Streptomyces cyaneofuscatus TaxID=66883 RepID=UPI002E167622|nr:helix-turn-helix domain-containing protein [Streptomyces cyaneofuscatus]WSI52733.1 helix-turn-helix domain-containing protein [Streptomyces cyaneofuscatus]